MSTERRLAELERRVLALSNTIRSSPGASTAGGAEFIRAPQMGFPAKLTSVYNATTGYNWEMRTLTSSGGVQDAGLPLTGTRAWEVAGRTDLASGDYVWLEPAPTGQGYLFYSPAGGTISHDEDVSPGVAYSLSSSATWADTGFPTISLPAAGTYLVYLKAHFFLSASAIGVAGAYMAARLYDTTAAAEVSGTRVVSTTAQVINTPVYTTATSLYPYTVSGASTIRVETWRQTGSTYSASQIGTIDSTTSTTVYGYIRLS